MIWVLISNILFSPEHGVEVRANGLMERGRIIRDPRVRGDLHTRTTKNQDISKSTTICRNIDRRTMRIKRMLMRKVL